MLPCANEDEVLFARIFELHESKANTQHSSRSQTCPAASRMAAATLAPLRFARAAAEHAVLHVLPARQRLSGLCDAA